MNDNVNNPSHYNQAGIEVIDVIETYTPNSPHLANVLKYVCRHSYKGNALEDLRKAQWYLARAIDILEGEEEDAAYVEQCMNTPEAVALRERIKVAVLDCFDEDTPYVDFPEWQDFPGIDSDEFEPTVDAYGRVTRCSPPVNIDGEEFADGFGDVDALDDDLDNWRDGRNAAGEYIYGTDEPESVVDALYVRTPPDRIAGDDEAATRIKDAYYKFDRNNVHDVCWNGCGEVLREGDLYITHLGKAFCSTNCVDDFAAWQKGER